MKLERQENEGEQGGNRSSSLSSAASSVPDSAISTGFFNNIPFDMGIGYPHLHLGKGSSTAIPEFVAEQAAGTGRGSQHTPDPSSGTTYYRTSGISAQVSPDANIDNDLFGYFPQAPRHAPTMSVSESSRSGSTSLTKMPSLRQIQAMGASNAFLSPNTASLGSTTQHSGNQKTSDTEDVTASNFQKVFDGVLEFSQTMSAAQADMAGLSFVVAEYLSWIVRVNGAGAGGSNAADDASNHPNIQTVLELMEARVRELYRLADESHRAAWKHLITVLQTSDIQPTAGGRGTSNAVVSELSAHGRKMERQAAETARFFSSSYNVCLPLPEQRAFPSSHDVNWSTRADDSEHGQSR